jgi:hypothetical protein
MKTCPSATFVHHKIPRAHPGLNPGRRGGKSATNRLSYGAAISRISLCVYMCIHLSLLGNGSVKTLPRQRIHATIELLGSSFSLRFVSYQKSGQLVLPRTWLVFRRFSHEETKHVSYIGEFEMLNAFSGLAFVFIEVSDAYRTDTNIMIFALRSVFSVHVTLRPIIADEWGRPRTWESQLSGDWPSWSKAFVISPSASKHCHVFLFTTANNCRFWIRWIDLLRLPHFLDIRLTGGGEVGSLTRRPLFAFWKMQGTNFR